LLRTVGLAAAWIPVFAGVAAYMALFRREWAPVEAVHVLVGVLVGLGLGLAFDVAGLTGRAVRAVPPGARDYHARVREARWPSWRVTAMGTTGVGLLVIRLLWGAGDPNPISDAIVWVSLVGLGGAMVAVAATARTPWRRARRSDPSVAGER
jgi:hypothetical protein